MNVRSEPCLACPYRIDVPSGIWAYDEYEKLRAYDAETWAQPPAGFRCHVTPEHYCHGWAAVHTTRGHEHDLLALRLDLDVKEIPVSALCLFSSGAEAADHGQSEIETPSDDAVEAIERLSRKYPRVVGQGER